MSDANVPWQRQQRQPEEDGILPLRVPQEETSSSSAVTSPSQNNTFPRGSGDTGHYLSTGPSFSSLATNGSTIVAQMPTPASASSASPAANATSNTATAGQTTSSTTTSAENECDLPPYQAGVGEEYTAPLGLPEQQQQLQQELQQRESYEGVRRQIPRTNSYYRRAGMTSRLDDFHYLANAPSFSSLSTTATSVASGMSIMGGNSRFDHLQPAPGDNNSRPSIATGNPAGNTGNSEVLAPATTSSTRNSNAGKPTAENIFLRQDDPEYQNLLISIATSTVVVGRQTNTNDPCGPRPTGSGRPTCSMLQQQQQHHRHHHQQQQQVVTSTRSSSCGMLGLHRPSSSSALRFSSSSSCTPRVASSSALRPSAGSILRRGRYSSGFLGPIREHEGAHPADGGEGSNRRNSSFNGTNSRRNSTNSNNNVQFTAPTIHRLVRDFQPNEMHGFLTNIRI